MMFMQAVMNTVGGGDCRFARAELMREDRSALEKFGLAEHVWSPAPQVRSDIGRGKDEARKRTSRVRV